MIKNSALKILGTLCFVILTTTTSIAIERTFEKEAYKYYLKLMDGKFDELEKNIEEAKSKKLILSDGQPRIAAIYGGVAGCRFLSCKFPRTLTEMENRKSMLEKWKADKPSSITSQVANAFYFVELGWFHRGGKYANKLTTAQITNFNNNVGIGKKLLNSLSKEAKNDVGWYSGMLYVALAEGWTENQFNSLFKEATELYPSHIPLYFYKNAYMKPKWYGNPQKFEQFVNKTVKNTKVHLGEQMYARLHWSGSSYKLFSSGRTNWSRMKKGFEELTASFDDQWNINNFAKFSCLAGDMKKLKDLLPRMNNKPMISAWYGDENFYYKCEKAANSFK